MTAGKRLLAARADGRARAILRESGAGAEGAPARPSGGPHWRGGLTSGDLRVRLARDAADIDAAQALRYRVFYEEMAARPSPETTARERDVDPFDAVCDHLLVVDRERRGRTASVVGTYRLIRREAASRIGGFYSASEYDIGRIVAYPGEILELGRSCVDAAYRNRATMQLLWRGIARYVFLNGIELMFGCASLPGTDPAALSFPLSYLYYHHLAPPALRPVALPRRYVDMRLLAETEVDPKRALAVLPPLVKGYLRVGGFIGDGAVVDDQFNTTDVCVVVKTDLVTERYFRHYERTAREVGVI